MAALPALKVAEGQPLKMSMNRSIEHLDVWQLLFCGLLSSWQMAGQGPFITSLCVYFQFRITNRVVNPRVRTRGWVGYGYDPGQKIGEWVHGFIPMTHPPLHG